MGTPQTWADIAERLGIPFAIVLLLFFFAATAAMWFARHVVRPVTKAHLDFVTHTVKNQDEMVAANNRQDARLAMIEGDAKEHDARVMDRFEKVLAKLERGCPLLTDASMSEKARQAIEPKP